MCDSQLVDVGLGTAVYKHYMRLTGMRLFACGLLATAVALNAIVNSTGASAEPHQNYQERNASLLSPSGRIDSRREPTVPMSASSAVSVADKAATEQHDILSTMTKKSSLPTQFAYVELQPKALQPNVGY